VPRIPLIEDLTTGPVPLGSNLLVEFDPASQWFNASITIAAGWLRGGGTVAYNATLRPPTVIRSQFNMLGLKPEPLEKEGRLEVWDWYTATLGQRSGENLTVDSLKIEQGARIPRWVFRNKSYLPACLRGLFDTDGCVYGFRRKPPATGSKAIISFEFGKGSFLAKDAQRALGRLGYLPRMKPHRNECRLAFNEDTVRFMREIKPANEKHWENFLRWHGPVV